MIFALLIYFSHSGTKVTKKCFRRRRKVSEKTQSVLSISLYLNGSTHRWRIRLRVCPFFFSQRYSGTKHFQTITICQHISLLNLNNLNFLMVQKKIMVQHPYLNLFFRFASASLKLFAAAGLAGFLSAFLGCPPRGFFPSGMACLIDKDIRFLAASTSSTFTLTC